ncbi:MAG: serine hydrolase domain-containing protein [Candidatus Zhuqueibacterota bacterium]
MKKMMLFVFCLLVLPALVWSQSHFCADHPEVAARIELFESWTQSKMDYENLPGLTVAIVYDQEIIYARGFGFADVKNKAPMTPETIFRIASITKVFTSTAIMQLRDAGKLNLDEPISKYLPWFDIKHRFPDAPAISIRHLLTHSSGLPREAAFPYWTDHKFPTLEQIKERLPDQETIYPSETKWKYSNLGMALLGEVVAAASGEDYETYIQNHILTPLSMTSTSVNLSKDHLKRLAVGYGRRLPDGRRKVMDFTDSQGLTPAANMSSTVEDLARFVSLQFRGGRPDQGEILKGSTLREMQRVHWLQDSWKSGWGLGFSISRTNDRTLVGHGGWVAGYRTQILFSPADKIGVIVMTNAEDGSPAMFANRMFDLVASAIQNAVVPKPEPAQPDALWEKYVGTYSDPTDWDYDVLVMDKKLVLYGHDYPTEENPVDNLIELTPVAEHTFRMTGTNGDGELLFFEMNKNGAVERIKMGENYIYPVKR